MLLTDPRVLTVAWVLLCFVSRRAGRFLFPSRLANSATPARPLQSRQPRHDGRSALAAQTEHAFQSGAAFLALCTLWVCTLPHQGLDSFLAFTAEAQRVVGQLAPQHEREKAQRTTTFQIFAKVASRHSILFDVRPTDTIEHLKRLVADTEGLPTDALRVVFRGQPRKDGETMAGLNIEEAATVHIAFRLCGGGNCFSCPSHVPDSPPGRAAREQMNSIPLKHVPRAVSGLLDEYHRTQHNKKITKTWWRKTSWRDLTSSDLQVIIQAVDPRSATAYNVPRVSELFLSQNPDVALSYRWSATLGDIYDGLCTACSQDETVWIDIFFNGQNAALTPEAVLDLTPKRYQNAKRHLLLVTSTQDLVALLCRGWICFEIAVRMISDKPMVELVDPHRKASELYQSGGLRRNFFEAMETFDPRDKKLIQDAIRNIFTRRDDTYLSGTDPADNFNRGVGDFVHLTGGKVLVADLAEQARWERILEEAWTLSDEMESRGKFADCLFVRQHLLKALQSVRGHEHLEVAKSLNNIGVVNQKQGYLEIALAKHEEALRIAIGIVGHEHLDVAKTEENIGNVYFRQGKFGLALPKYEFALRIKTRDLGHEHLDVAASLNNMGVVYEKQGEFGLALAKYEESLRIWVKHHGHEHLDVAASLINIGATLREMGNLQGALEKASEGINIVEKQTSRCHPYVAEALNDQGVALQRLGLPLEAAAKCEEALQVYGQLALASDHPDVRTARVCLAVALCDADNLSEAAAIHDELLPAYKDLRGLALRQFDALSSRLGRAEA